jgi:hypothetical protein
MTYKFIHKSAVMKKWLDHTNQEEEEEQYDCGDGYFDHLFRPLTLCSPGKFAMAAFVRPDAQKGPAEIYPVQLIARCLNLGRLAFLTGHSS